MQINHLPNVGHKIWIALYVEWAVSRPISNLMAPKTSQCQLYLAI